MRFTELIIFSVLLAVFSSLLSSFIYQTRKLDEKLFELRRKTDSLIFISESFNKLCAGEKKGFESFDEWEAVCKSMWNLESIEWKKMTAVKGNGENVFLGRWQGPYGSGEVYCKRQVKENESN